MGRMEMPGTGEKSMPGTGQKSIETMPPPPVASEGNAPKTAGLALVLPTEFVEAVARRVAELLRAEMPEPVSPSPFMTVLEAAAYLRCSRQRVDDLLSQRRLTRVKEGTRTLVLRAEIESYLRG